MSDTTASEASTLKSKGNALFRDGKFLESIIEYSAAVELDRRNPVLYSNRSLAFLKLGQHFYALKDAETTIQLNPDWSKGYYRKGQVEESAEQFKAAEVSYKHGLQVNPADEGLGNAIAELGYKRKQYENLNSSRIKKYAIVSGVLASTVLAADMATDIRIFSNQILRWILITFSAFVGVIVAYAVNRYRDARKKALLQPPEALLDELESESLLTTTSTSGDPTSEESSSKKYD